ncbi:MAG: prepilin-type N-terminal cleavage/methylation domain-containing protein [Planctomycetes bacterium]|nr:prepilin-type N-terminal cleavage/methylation domain-containing protein [Planctomycetota bacterium]
MKSKQPTATTFGRKRRRAAFTLAELMMVLAIMSLLLSMSVAAYNSMATSKGIDGARKTIVGTLFTARMKAIRDRRTITAALSVPNAEDSGWIVSLSGSGANQVGVINRMARPTDTSDTLRADESVRKEWDQDQFKPTADKGYWACVVGGPPAGSKVMIRTAVNGWELQLSSALSNIQRNNSFLCIVEGSPDDSSPPVIEQYKISSDMLAGAWETLPKFVIVDGTYFPISFRPDGTAAFPYDHAVIRLRDIRLSPNKWQWRMIVDRGSGGCSISRIRPNDKDSAASF